jgi:hypothetical protein
MVFNGKINSDFLKLLKIEETDKQKLINFASTDFATLRFSLIQYIKSVYPLDFNNFSESELGMMLIELVAYMGHVLSYKADYLANENYLKTARSRKSVKKLMELIGIRMLGPIAAAADARLTLLKPITWGDSDELTINSTNRVISIVSPADGLPLSYTLYKVSTDGDIDNSADSADLIIYGFEKQSNSVATNLVLHEGNLVVQTGTFSESESLKSVVLNKSPVIEGSVTAFIQGDPQTSGNYTMIQNTFFASGGSSKTFQLVSDDNYGGTLFFGDNNYGKSPRAGDSYLIQYRTGGGSRGNIPTGLINVPLQTIFNGVNIPSIIENISIGTGGVNSETIEHVKRYAPQKFRSLDRLVTLNDFKAFANSYVTNYGSVGKATAVTRKAYSSANIIDVYVLEKASDLQLRKSTSEYKRQLIAAMNERKMLTDEIIVVDGLIRTIELSITIRMDEKFTALENSIKSKINNVINNFFSTDNNDFGKEYNPQDLLHSIFEINEVRFATVDNMPNVVKVQFNEIIQLNNFNLTVIYV